jgi:acetyl-CoA synthetase
LTIRPSCAFIEAPGARNSSRLNEALKILNPPGGVKPTSPSRSYADACAGFSWGQSLEALGWTADGAVNLADTLVERHAGSAGCALRWFGKTGAERVFRFDELARLANRFAGFLVARGVRQGDRVAGFLPRIPETLAVMLGAWKIGAVYVPIFTGFGADAIAFRMKHSGATLLCTHHEYRDRVPPLAPDTTVVTIGGGGRPVTGDVDFRDAVSGQPGQRASVACRRDDPAVLLYTSGSTGPPKGVRIATNFVLAVHPYITLGVDLQPDDVFWPTGDPGWGYGLVCYTAALALGVPVVVHEAAPTPELALRRIGELGVTNLATTPTLLRGIMALGEGALRARPTRLRRVSSCGEPLNAEVVGFFRSAWNVTPMDHYGSSEFGLPIGNLNAVDMVVKPGSMGLPLPGHRMAVVDDAGAEVPAGAVGHIVMAPSEIGYYALGYWDSPEGASTAPPDASPRTDGAGTGRARTEHGREASDLSHVRGAFVTSGDLGRKDADGYFWFEGRADDVITSAGYRIGPFEIESVLLEHPAVAEAAVVGKPDALRGQIVKAFVTLRPGAVAGPSLTREIVELVKTRVGRHQYPREVEVVSELPKTETGKIQRFQLRQR